MKQGWRHNQRPWARFPRFLPFSLPVLVMLAITMLAPSQTIAQTDQPPPASRQDAGLPELAETTELADDKLAGPILAGPQLVPPPLLPLVPKSTGQNSEDPAAVETLATFTTGSATDSFTPTEVLPENASGAMMDFLANVIRDNIPAHHLDEKDWNGTKKIYAGIKFRREGLKIETERRWKTVNHGLWKKYEAKLVDPAKTLDVRLTDVHWQPDGRLHAHLTIVSEMLVNVWQTQWNLGVRVYAIQSEVRVRTAMDVDATVGFQLDPTSLPPALVVDPHVESASLRLSSFHVNRIGNLGGDVAEELGDASESLIRNFLVKPQSEKLASKLNRQIDKKRDKLRLDAGDWLNRWFQP